MRHTVNLAAAAAATLSVAHMTSPAFAACQRMGFLVNDYGKDGPTKDAKDLLDKHIAKTLAAKGITKYTTGTKSVSCEMFLNFIVFDEHTCTASATVCWDGTPLPKGETAAVDPAAAKAPAEIPPRQFAPPCSVRADHSLPSRVPGLPRARCSGSSFTRVGFEQLIPRSLLAATKMSMSPFR